MEDPFIANGKWTSTFTIPMVQCSTILIDDDPLYESNGNWNNKVEKGETVEMVPLIDNKSEWVLSNVTAQFIPLSDSIRIKDSIQSFSSIAAGSINNYYNTDMALTKNSKAASFNINMLLNGTFDESRAINYNYVINFINGITLSQNKYLIPATGNVIYSRIEFYQNVTPNAANPQNLIGPGRKVRFKVQVQNNLNIRTYALRGIIRCSDKSLAITDSTAAYDEVNASQLMWSRDEFEVTIPNELPASGVYLITLKIQDPFIANGTWTNTFKLPFLQISRTVLDDDDIPDSNGNGDGIIQPGETIEIFPLLKNTTSFTFYTASGTLSSADNNITIWNNKTGASGPVYNTWRYNFISGAMQPINPATDNIMTEEDFVFDYNLTGTYSRNLDLKVATYLNGVQGDTWDVGGIQMNYSLPIVLNQGYPTGPLQITAGGPTNFCTGSSVNLVISSGTATGFKYQWKKNNTNITGATNTIYGANQGGTYQAVGTDSYSNSNSSNIISLTAVPSPNTNVTASGPTQICGTGSVTLNATTGTNYTYQWYNNSALITGQTNQRLTATQSGNYKVLVSNGGCSAYSTVTTFTITAIPAAPLVTSPVIYCQSSISNQLSATGSNLLWYNSAAGGNGSQIAPTPLTTNASTTNYYLSQTVNTCESPRAIIAVTVNICGYVIVGFVTYDNISNTVLSNVKLVLKSQDNKKIDSTYSDIYGYYEFNNISNGTYTIVATSKSDVRQINPLDALLVNRNYIQIYNFPDYLKSKAADVNIDNTVNPLDALLINRFFINVITSFKSGAWLFETPIVNVNSGNVNHDIKGICFGDVNASY